MSGPSSGIDRRLARRRFERAFSTYSGAARLEDEVNQRMLERLDYVRVNPRRVLDAGSGPPRRALARRYPRATVIALDFSLPMLPRRGLAARLFGARSVSVCANLERLPLAQASVDLVWSNMALHWVGEPQAAFAEFRRVLTPEGLLMFSTLGPDTLKELRAAAGAERVHAFIDMHDLGDMLLAAGFAAPVMDMEMVTIEYPETHRLLDDLRATGQTSARADRPRGLSGRAFLQRLRQGLGERPKASYEVVYGHAWSAPLRAREEEVKPVRIFRRVS